MEDSSQSLTWLLVVACLGSGMMAGLFVSFSMFMMKALGSLAPPDGIKAMQAINRFIVRPSYLMVFLGTGLLLAVACYVAGSSHAMFWIVLAATVVYIAACIVSTVWFNVPLNDELDGSDPHDVDSHHLWRYYLTEWTKWNHVRAAACVLSTLLLGFSLAAL